jgi:uncharacterized protein
MVGPGVVAPALYEGNVTHARESPLINHFRYRTGYWLVDYDRLPQPRRWMRLVASVRREDHADIRSLLNRRGVVADRILVLATARTLGYVFNPLSVYWCYDRSGETTAILLEVHNTYGGRHVYVLSADDAFEAPVKKELDVSPFYSLSGNYRVHISQPGPTVKVTVRLEQEGSMPFVSTMVATRRPFTVANMVYTSFRYTAIRTSVLIRWQALRLWARGLKVARDE